VTIIGLLLSLVRSSFVGRGRPMFRVVENSAVIRSFEFTLLCRACVSCHHCTVTISPPCTVSEMFYV